MQLNCEILCSGFREFTHLECLQRRHTRYASLNEGAVAGYIPELAKADSKSFGGVAS